MKYLVFFAFSLISITGLSQNKLPETPIRTLQKTETNLVELSKKSEFMVISLWATWCFPCKNELNAINDVYQDWKKEIDVIFYAISIDDQKTVNNVRPMVNGKGWDFTVLLDTNNDLKRALSASTVPLTLVIKNGEIIYRHSGYTPGNEEDIYNILKENK